MQGSNGSRAADTAKQLPELGPNKLMQALEDYDRLVDELANVKRSLAEYTDLTTKLAAENDAIKSQLKDQAEFMTRQLDAMTAHRDRLNTALQSYIASYRIIRQTIESKELEALQLGLGEKPADTVKDERGLPVNRLST
jgi:hypothetical protein